jgi:PilZ domain
MARAAHEEWFELMNTTAELMGNGERRKSFRVPLQWTVYFASETGTFPRRSETKNLSRDGFYCFLEVPLTAGEHFDCDIVIPTHMRDGEDVMSLRCRAQVIRVEKVGAGEQYGLACRIEDYRVIHIPRDEASLWRGREPHRI